ncbi:MAG: peptide deformylase [Proteobacteria bacterium]|nr:peptide deformylase [Pseudomonadota bacterium]
MAILKIARMGHPVLRQAAEMIIEPTAPRIQSLVQDMYETMIDADGTGLAAPQVHVPLRLVMFFVGRARAAMEDEEGEEAEAEDDGVTDSQEVPLTVLINPVVEPLSDETELGWEGCLSVPGLIGKVPRHTKVRYRGFAPDGTGIDRIAEGFHARVVQHECDHLDGFLYPQRMNDLSLLMFRDEMRYGVPGESDETGASKETEGDD